jgi:nucleotide-binding universal stress UspA family protein
VFERIVLAVDGADEAGGAITAAVDLARTSGGEVLVVHVDETSAGTRAGAAFADEVARFPAGVVDAVRAQGVSARGEARVARVNAVAREILLAAAGFDADAIVLGSRRLGAFAGLLLGSVAYKVIQLADCPVMVVKPVAATTEDAPPVAVARVKRRMGRVDARSVGHGRAV